MNSIKSNLTKDEVFGDIRLSLSHDIYNEKVFIVLEGDDDIKFWNNMVHDDKIELIESFCGKAGVIEIVQTLEKQKNIIGIVDRDYDENSNFEKIFYYDYCNLEMMLIKSDEVFRSCYSEYYRGTSNFSDLRLYILSELRFISNLRKFNSNNGLDININGISFKESYISDKNVFCRAKLIKKLKELNSSKIVLIDDNLIHILEKSRQTLQYEDYLLITRGHDFIYAFNAVCDKYINGSINSKDVSSSLRCSYRKDDLINTQIYRELIDYQRKNNLRII